MVSLFKMSNPGNLRVNYLHKIFSDPFIKRLPSTFKYSRCFFKILKASATLSSEWRYKIEGVQIGPVQDLEKSKEGTIRAPQVPWTLPSPDEGRQKTFIFGEVVSAHGFEYDHVSIILKNSSNAQVGFKA